MSLMSTSVSAAMSDLWDFAADAGTYTPPGGDPVSLQVRIDKDIVLEPDGLTVRIAGEQIRAKVLIDDMGQEPTARRPGGFSGGVFLMSSGEHAGSSFEVTEKADRDNHFYTCAVKDITT